MTEIRDAAREEVERRHPVWRDTDLSKTGPRYRAGFIAGAEWAANRSGARLRSLTTELEATRRSAEAQISKTVRELDRQKALVEAAKEVSSRAVENSLEPGDSASREQLILQVSDMITGAEIEFGADGHAYVAKNNALAREVVELVLARRRFIGRSPRR